MKSTVYGFHNKSNSIHPRHLRNANARRREKATPPSAEAQLWDYFLFVKLKKHWQPKSLRQARAATQLFFVDLLGHTDWTAFAQIQVKDHDTLPAVLTRQQVRDLIAHIRLRRYRTPIKLIYVCGLRLSECLALTIHDLRGLEKQLFIRNSKGHQDRVVPLPTELWRELQRYWLVHRHPLLIFPNVGRGDNTREVLAQRMRRARAPMPCSSLQRLLIVARKELNLPAASIDTLRHSFATHLLEAGAHLHTHFTKPARSAGGPRRPAGFSGNSTRG